MTNPRGTATHNEEWQEWQFLAQARWHLKGCGRRLQVSRRERERALAQVLDGTHQLLWQGLIRVSVARRHSQMSEKKIIGSRRVPKKKNKKPSVWEARKFLCFSL